MREDFVALGQGPAAPPAARHRPRGRYAPARRAPRWGGARAGTASDTRCPSETVSRGSTWTWASHSTRSAIRRVRISCRPITPGVSRIVVRRRSSSSSGRPVSISSRTDFNARRMPMCRIRKPTTAAASGSRKGSRPGCCRCRQPRPARRRVRACMPGVGPSIGALRGASGGEREAEQAFLRGEGSAVPFPGPPDAVPARPRCSAVRIPELTGSRRPPPPGRFRAPAW